MTEAEWLAATDPLPMLEFIRDRLGRRKVRLFACACCRSVWDGTETAKSRRSVEVAERYADGLISADRLVRAWSAGTKPGEWLAARCVRQDLYEDLGTGVLGYAVRLEPMGAVSPALLRDIFGNPFRPVAFADSWRTETAVALATGIYQDRAFDRMPILADALEEAGCDELSVFSHCRGDGPHVRGCWVVDSVLCKG